jgi:hypothetical protein
MGLLSGVFGGNQARALREQARQLRVQQYREQEAFRLQTEAVNSSRLDLFEKDRLAQEAERLALEALSTPGASILLGEQADSDPDAVLQRRAGFFAQSTSATV